MSQLRVLIMAGRIKCNCGNNNIYHTLSCPSHDPSFRLTMACVDGDIKKVKKYLSRKHPISRMAIYTSVLHGPKDILEALVIKGKNYQVDLCSGLLVPGDFPAFVDILRSQYLSPRALCGLTNIIRRHPILILTESYFRNCRPDSHNAIGDLDCRIGQRVGHIFLLYVRDSGNVELMYRSFYNLKCYPWSAGDTDHNLVLTLEKSDSGHSYANCIINYLLLACRRILCFSQDTSLDRFQEFIAFRLCPNEYEVKSLQTLAKSRVIRTCRLYSILEEYTVFKSDGFGLNSILAFWVNKVLYQFWIRCVFLLIFHVGQEWFIIPYLPFSHWSVFVCLYYWYIELNTTFRSHGDRDVNYLPGIQEVWNAFGKWIALSETKR